MRSAPRRRAAAAIGLAVLGAGAGALPALGQQPPPPPPPPRFTPGELPAEHTGDAVTIAGTAEVDDGWTITSLRLELVRVEEREGCPPAAVDLPVYDSADAPPGGETTTSTTVAPTDPTTAEAVLSVVPVCNGRYDAVVVVVADRDLTNDGNDVDEPPPAPDDDIAERVDLGELTVSLRPPDPTGATLAQTDGGNLQLTWNAPAGYTAEPVSPPGFAGYRVQRASGDTYEDVATVAPATLAHDLGAATPGVHRYRVLTLRQAADESTTVTSSGATSAVAELRIRPPATETTATTRPLRASAPPVRRPTPATVQGTVPPVTVDEGFSETLDYGDAEPGETAAVEPEDAGSFLDFAGSPGSGILVPFAIAECLAVWAFHLRYLARRADQL